MNKLKWVVVLLLSSTAISAATLDQETIQGIHQETKKAFAENCMTGFKNVNQPICDCLAAKAAESVDDNELSKCNNDVSGTDCISKAVTHAAAKASSPESMKDCKSQPKLATTTDTAVVVPSQQETTTGSR